MANISDITWNDVQEHVRLTYPQLVRGWFAQLEPTHFEGGVLSIETRNRAQSRYLDRHCRQAFAEAAQAATGRLVTIEFAAPPQDLQELPDLPETDADLPLNGDYTFDDFVTGPCNRLAHAAAVSIADSPGVNYNPFFIHGSVGLGKTHLLQAICHGVKHRNGRQNGQSCRYISCEMFTNQYMEAVQSGSLYHFHQRYRDADLLVIDDVQFLSEKERSQEELFHTFNALTQSGRQIVLSADCAPREIPNLEERLVSRFNAGLVASLERPCLETRIAIVQRKARARGIDVPDDVAELIARQVDRNIRELEGALIRIDAMSQLENEPVTYDLARRALGAQPSKVVAIPTIMEVVASRMEVKVTSLQSKSRTKHITLPRHVCMYIARELTGKSFDEIGGFFGGRDHTTVLHAHRTIESRIREDVELRQQVQEIMGSVRNAI